MNYFFETIASVFRSLASLFGVDNEDFLSLRAKANVEGDQMARNFEGSTQAYNRGERALAKELSNKGKEHKAKMEQYNQQASDLIFAEKNQNRPTGEIDLHGLYVKEAISRTEHAIKDAKARGDSTIQLIVGKGLHSQDGAAKIRPAIEDLMRRYNLVAELDPRNSGVLIVRIDASGSTRSRGVKADEITQRLKREDQGCLVM